MDTGDRRVPIAAAPWGQMSPSALRTRRRWPFRTDLALLGLIAVQPLEQAVPPDAIEPDESCGGDLPHHADPGPRRHGACAPVRRRRCDPSRPPGDRFGASTLVADSPSDAVATTVRLGGFVALLLTTTESVDDPRLVHRLLWVLSLSAAVASMSGDSNMLGGCSLLAEPTHGDSNDLAYFLADNAADDGLVDPSSAPLQTARRRVLRHDGDGRRVLAESRCVRWPRRRRGLPGVDGTSRAEGDRALDRGGGGGGGEPRDDASSDVVDGDLCQRARGRRERRVARRALARSHGPGDGHPFLGVGPGNFEEEVAEASGRPALYHRRSWCTTHIWRWRQSSESGGSSRSSPSC